MLKTMAKGRYLNGRAILLCLWQMGDDVVPSTPSMRQRCSRAAGRRYYDIACFVGRQDKRPEEPVFRASGRGYTK
jgi:hypothetical protein